ncbi:uncharacterized protein DS421_14g470070 [Arachis hypogaea]|nr:uncharacterized protein DS421_14g470070 [Arachis hypogaea]
MCRGVMAVASTTIGVVEVLKDQGYCRWNTTMKSVAQGAKNHVKSAQQKANSNKKKMPQQRFYFIYGSYLMRFVEVIQRALIAAHKSPFANPKRRLSGK